MSQSKNNSLWASLILILCSSFFWAARTFWIGLPYSSEGLGALGNAAYAIVLLLFILILAGASGSRVLKFFPTLEWTSTEKICLSISIGLGLLGNIVFAMGLAGFIQPFHFLILLGLYCITFSAEFTWIYRQLMPTILYGLFQIKKFSFSYKVLAGVGSGIILLTLSQSLTPPFNYDALMYHLQSPRLFLEEGRILPLYDNWLTFYPFTGEMVNLLGLALGSDIFARLIHFSTLVLILLITFAMAKRVIPHSDGFLVLAILFGVPVLFLWGSQANNDLTLVLFQLLAVFLLLIWIEKQQTGYLVLAGILQGLALGSKYLAFSGFVIIILIILLSNWHPIRKPINILNRFRQAILFGGIALLVASPWYIKNILWTGNPIYPFFFQNKYIDPLQIDLWSTYMNSYGTGKSWLDYLTLPINLYAKPGIFSTWFGAIDIPSPLFVMSIFYPLAIRHYTQPKRRIFHLLAVVTFIQFIFWAVGSQQTRFLFLIYPGLSVLACSFLIWFRERLHYGKKIVFGISAILMLISLTIISAASIQVNPFKLFFGEESKQQFLSRMVSDYDGMQFIQSELPSNAKVMLLWDGQGYYCDSRCVPDLFQSQWTALYQEYSTISAMRDVLFTRQITHLMINQSDTEFFLSHDPTNQHRSALTFLTDEFVPLCTKTVYKDKMVSIFELEYQNPNCQ